MADILLTTIIKRPYVVCFLIAFLFLSIRHLGLLRAFVWLFAGYLIAFISEYSSIHNGFPYGEYHYIYENLKGEWLFCGVPVWDSVSYSFMTYAGFSTAKYLFPSAKLWKLCLGGAFLTMMLDVITDPVAKLGRDWFLGEIYYYAVDGWYFHVPLSNFAGWFLVAFAIIGVNILLWRGKDGGKPSLLDPLFYISICLFNTAIAFSISAYLLGAVNLMITAALTSAIFVIRKRQL